MPNPHQPAIPVPLIQGGTGVEATSAAALLSALGAGSSAGVAAAQADATTALANAATAQTTANAAAAKTANLSDLTNAGTARTNLSLVPGTHVQTQSSKLQQVADATAPTALGLAGLAEGAPVIDPATPYSPAVATKQIIRSTSGTINLDSTGRTPGDRITVVATATIVVSGDPQGADTLDGASDTVAVDLVAGQQVVFLLQSATAWRSVQPVASGGADFVTTSIYPYDETAYLGPDTTPAGSFAQTGTIGGP